MIALTPSCILLRMSRPSPFARGFRALRREPSVLAAEIGWRWLFGGVATALVLWATMAFLHAITVTKSNQFLLSTLNPELVGYAFREMFRGKWWMLARVSFVVSVGVSFLWIVTGTIARSATTRVLVERAGREWGEERTTGSNLGAIAGIQFVRIGLLWVGLAAYVVSAVVASRLTMRGDVSNTGAFLLLFLCMFGVSAVVLSFFNWILFLAPIFAVRDSLSFTSAAVEGWRLSRARAGSLIGLNLAHGGFRLVWLVFMSGIVFVPFGFARVVPKVIVLVAVLVLSLVYFAVADAFFVARYAGYIEIAEQELHPEPAPPPLPAYEPPAPQPEPVPAYISPEGGTVEEPGPSEAAMEPSVPPETPGN